MRPKLTYANVVSTLCLFILLGGAAYAGMKLPKNSVGTKQLKKNAVKGSKVANRSLTAADIRGPVQLATTAGLADRATSADRAADADLLGGAPPAAFVAGSRVARAHSEATIAAGGRRDPLLRMGPLTLETNCENSGLAVYVRIYASTSASGGRARWAIGGDSGAGGGGKGVSATPASLFERSTTVAEAGAGHIVYSDPNTTISFDFGYDISNDLDSCTVDGVALQG